MRSCLLLICILLSAAATGQSRDRIYTQTDKSGYVSGETIWFKTYLLSGFVPGSIGTNLYVDLRNGSGNPLWSGRVPVLNGIASGSLDLPLQLKPGIYFLRTFTRTQPSAEIHSVYIQPVYVFNPKAASTPGMEYDYTAVFRTASGNLAAGLENTVFVTLKDRMGRPVAADMEVLDSNNERLLSLSSDARGLGIFRIRPVNGQQYTARVRYADGSTRNFRLPDVETEKLVVSISDAQQAKVYSIWVPEQLRNKGAMTVRGFMDEHLIFQKNFNADAEKITARIPTDELPMGLLQLIVTDAQQHQLGRAVSWIMPDSALLPVKFRIDSLDLQPGGRNVFSLRLPENTLGSFSVAITDADNSFQAADNNIISGLLLNPDSKQASYHSDLDLTKKDELELALGSSDWTDQSLYAGKASLVADSDHITIRGRLLNKGNRKPLTKGDLTLMYTSKDSVTSFAAATLGKDGSVVLPKMIFEGKQQFKYSLNGNKWADLEMVIDSSDADRFTIPFEPPVVWDRSPFISDAIEKSATQLATALAADSISSTGLRTVTVQARRQTAVQQVNDRYTHGLFTSMMTAKTLDLVTDPPFEGGNILDYLSSKIAGLIITYLGNGNYMVASNRQLSLNYMPPPKLYLNETETTTDFLKSISVKDVALVKYYPPGMGSFPGVGIAAVLAIYTRNPNEKMNSGLAPMGSFSYEGYTPAKDFRTDFLDLGTAAAAKRTTVYWDPNMQPEEDKPEYRIRFNNSASAKKLRVRIEGFTIDGKLLHFEQVIEQH
ncbi:MAG: hypothetical protein JO301_02275 [Chitinophagaceae bacterium]|nr:hypothetical protein [Chitinophagaceae bacterium]